MATVSLQQITKSFGATEVVRGVSLEIADNEFLVLLGPSGCGKSTVLRMIAGLEDPTSGTIAIGDVAVNGIDARQRDVAMVFQSYALYPHMTVAQNIEAPLLGRGSTDGTKLGRSARRALAAEAAEVVGLQELLGRKPAELSGGQRQRVALARAIVRRPQVFLMDEPLSNLDAKLRTQTRLGLVELWRRLQTTIVYVTHDQVEAMTMATRIGVMADGVLQQVGTPDDVYHDPANLFVARFIGSPQINVLPTDAVVGAAAVLPSRAATVAVRPEHVHLISADEARAPSRTGAIDLPVRVRAAEHLGHETHLVCDVEGSVVTARCPSGQLVPPVGGEAVLRLDAAQLLFFDLDGERVRP